MRQVLYEQVGVVERALCTGLRAWQWQGVKVLQTGSGKEGVEVEWG